MNTFDEKVELIKEAIEGIEFKMTETELRSKLVNNAVKHLGAAEGTAAHKAIIDTYNKISPLPRGYKMTTKDPWCAAFVSSMFYETGMLSIIHPECSCTLMIAGMQKLGSWVENDAYAPKPGDLIFYDWDDSGKGENTGGPEHVGIVVSCDGKNIKVIEGNKSNAVNYRTIAVNGRYIRGFGVPKFSKLATAASSSTPAAKPATTCTITLPILRQGAKSYTVGVMQRELIKKGYYCGSYRDDGSFGPSTLAALNKFQDRTFGKHDGICGPDTWNKLLK